MTDAHSRRDFIQLASAASAVGVAAAIGSPADHAGAAPRRQQATVKVCGDQWGVSTRDIGVVGGKDRFFIEDLLDLGVTNYRLYIQMDMWEPQDDDGAYGSPSIDEIKADPDVVDWAYWDRTMENWGNGKTPSQLPWYADMRDAGIDPVLCLRLIGAAWSEPFNPPVDDAGRNEWWQHVFAAVYWLNVRNDYRIDRWQVLNEPNLRNRDWHGEADQYADLVRLTHDAINHVYSTYLPGRKPLIYAPVVALTRRVGDMFPDARAWQFVSVPLQQSGEYFDILDNHDYTGDVSEYVKLMRQLATEAGYPDRPIFISEWNKSTLQHDPELNLKVSTGINLIENLIRMSWPGEYYVDGSQFMMLYENPRNNLPRLIDIGGIRNPPYFAFRMAIRALQGAKPTYESVPSAPMLMSMTTRDDDGAVWFLLTNRSTGTEYQVDVDLSALGVVGRGTLWEYGDGRDDEIVDHPVSVRGHVDLRVRANSAVLVRFDQFRVTR